MGELQNVWWSAVFPMLRTTGVEKPSFSVLVAVKMQNSFSFARSKLSFSLIWLQLDIFFIKTSTFFSKFFCTKFSYKKNEEKGEKSVLWLSREREREVNERGVQVLSIIKVKQLLQEINLRTRGKLLPNIFLHMNV
jgi:hypothetical protein